MGRLRQYLDVVRHQEHPWWFVVGRTLMALRLSPFFRIRKERFTLRFYDSSLSLALWLRPQPSLAARFFDRYLKPGDVVVDVGANVGLYSVVCATCVGDTGTVIALEPSPRIANFLRGNVAVNRLSNVRVLNVAVGDADGEDLHLESEPGRSEPHPPERRWADGSARSPRQPRRR
ncbi:MAG: FkbM family methyltransferase [Vicinamibacterales bacterium]